ncbi:MAG: YitT family protein [Saprospiraceae bacterium]
MKRKTIDLISEYAQILLGILLSSIGLKAFLLPNGFLDGGVTGIAILISELTDIDISWLLIITSLPFLVISWFIVSRKIVIKSVISIVILSLFIHYENFNAITDDKLLISIFGGLLLGAGIGLTIKNGAVLDGSEILGVFIHDKYGISIGRIILVFNIILFTFTAIFLSVEVAMYSILTYLVTAKIIDFMIEGFEDYVGLMIVSSQSEALERQLIHKVGTGMTIYQGARGYGSKGKQEGTNIIHVVINRMDIRKTYNAINEVDNDAFIIEFDINNIKGGVMRKYLSKKDNKKLSPTVYEN